MIAANSYSGATTTSRRSLALSSSGTNESSSGVHNNGTLDISNVTTSSPPIKALDGTGNTILGQKTLTMTNANSTFGNNYAGVMSGTGGLTIAAGTQTLSGQNTYIGTTDVAQKVSLTLSGRIAGALNNIGTTDVKGGAVGGATDNTGTLTAENGTFQAITNSGTAKPSNSQTGGTTVVSNILQVDGDLSGATGDMDVQSGAQLSGKGVIGGNVTIADNATLSPGEGTNSVTTLKINGNLNLAYNAVQNCNLGKDNAEDEQNKDLVAVKGDLVFSSTINVTGQNRRSEPLGQGIYRIYTYEGSLSGAVPTASYRAAANGAGETIGPNGRLGSLETAPSTTMLLQTSIDHQINLVVSDNVLTFWDGGGTVSPGPGGMEGNNTVNGGTGTWTTDNANWTDVNGGRDGAWTQGTFALFAAQAGTVTVRNTTHDGTASNVLTHGMQFANNDGSVYKVTGADLYATTATTTIRVGDGTQQGASVTTVLDTVIDNSRVNNGTKLVKSDAGTLILTKDQNYRGETLISGVTTT